MFFFVVGAYLLGSVSSAILISRAFNLPDPRQHGSNNPGATNVYRLSGKLPAVGVLLFDMAKGLVPVCVGYYGFNLSAYDLGLVAVAACLGHMYPIFFGFKGGKGVATALGCLIPLDWGILASVLCTWVAIYRIFRFSSLAAIVTVCIAPAMTFWLKPDYLYPVAMLCALVLFQHRSNIQRLYNRTEPKT